MNLKQYITKEKLKEVEEIEKNVAATLNDTDFDDKTKKKYYDTIMEYQIVHAAAMCLYYKINDMDKECEGLAKRFYALPDGYEKNEIARKHNDIVAKRDSIARFKLKLMDKLEKTEKTVRSITDIVINRANALKKNKKV